MVSNRKIVHSRRLRWSIVLCAFLPDAVVLASDEVGLAAVERSRKYYSTLNSAEVGFKYEPRALPSSQAISFVVEQEMALDIEGRRAWIRSEQRRRNASGEIVGSASVYSEDSISPEKILLVSCDGKSRKARHLASFAKPPSDFFLKRKLLYIGYAVGFLCIDGRSVRVLDLLMDGDIVYGSHGSATRVTCQAPSHRLIVDIEVPDGAVRRIEYRAERGQGELSYVYEVKSFSEGSVRFPSVFTCVESFPSESKTSEFKWEVRDGSEAVVHTPGVSHTEVIPARSDSTLCVVTKFRHAPPDALNFSIRSEIPNGTLVGVQDAQHLSYVWENGKVVPAGTDLPIGLPRARIPETNSSRLFLLIFGNIVFAVLVGLALLFRRGRTFS